MIVEPMTDAELDGLRSKIFAYNRKERSRLRLFGQNVIRILARLDAERTRADAARQEGYREGVEAAAEWCRVQAYCAAIREQKAANEQARRAALLVKQTLDHAADVLPALSPPPAKPSAPVAPDWPTRCAALEADGIAARKRGAALEAENAALRERNEKLAKGLKPFAADAEGWADAVPDEHRPRCTEPGSDTAHPGSETAYTVGDLRRARALLQGGPDAG